MSRESISEQYLEEFQTELPYSFADRIFDIVVVRITENGEDTGTYKPRISVKGKPIAHDVPRCEDKETAHNEALRWIKNNYGV
jgi:hypothetical protein